MPGQRRSPPGPAIRNLRELAGMTLMDVARDAGVSVAYLNKVETEQMLPTRAYVAKVADAIAKGMRDAS